MNLTGKKITIHDMSLRDGMHPKQHQITVEQMVTISKAMDEAGIPMIEVTHGDGLGGASVNYGFPAATDEEYLTAVCKEMKNTKVSALLLPGIGTVDHLKWRSIAASRRFVWQHIAPRRMCRSSTLRWPQITTTWTPLAS